VQRREAGVAYQLIKPARPGDLFECIMTRPRIKLPVAPPPPEPRAPRAPRTVPPDPPAKKPVRVRKVLLAEDNPVNVEVAKAMLDSLDLKVRIARNGDEALQAARAENFDIVLMDCQMPVMDGFAATAEIRRHEQANGRARTLPIIAITANALQGDREACLAAGMDDYLSKPFTQQQLAAVIGRWIGMPIASTVHHDDEPPVLPPEVREVIQRDVINRHALDNIRALNKDRGDALVQKVVAAYVDDTPSMLQTLRCAIAQVDCGNLRKVAHSLKSSSANVGAESLAQMCKEMEALGRSETTDGATAILIDMEHEFQAVRHSLNAILEKEN
jgi:CheY-like chemotaxis protein